MRKTQKLSPTELRDWLHLCRTENVGAVTFRQLLRLYQTPAKAIAAIPAMAARGGKRNLKLPDIKIIENELRSIKDRGGRIIASCEPDYPDALAAIEDAPPVISVIGDIAHSTKRCVGIVGARNASLNGRKLTETLARDLCAEGITIVSGLARGIDTAAHNASLETGTIAVLAGGVDKVYPEENRALYDKIAAKGCVISDQPLGLDPFSKLFPRRNRIISGLSLGVVVVEAATQSGSLITARMALEQGREVFAVPGSPLDPRCRGTNDLIRQGAILTEAADDVLRNIHKPRLQGVFSISEPKNDFEVPIDLLNNELQLIEIKDIIIENLSPAAVLVDELVRQCDLSLPLALTALLELELAGRVERQAGNRVALIG
ncbi:MAG: DNA-protecting protein DprA [Alphaproteobacteria bacterium]|nr:DNA-protecting protein DprA [Alphaproteobacteria bacterium]MBV8547838.1 DNA-protecting protein DprA [Alphaproteobacteria bacterium]